MRSLLFGLIHLVEIATAIVLVTFYFVLPLRRSAQRFFMRSDSFLQPAAVRRLPPRSGALLTFVGAFAEIAFIAAYLRFMASEIFFPAAALRVFLA